MLILIIAIIVISALMLFTQKETITNQELSISKLRQTIAAYECQIGHLNKKAEKLDRIEDQLKTGFLESQECKEYKAEFRKLNQQIDALNREILKHKAKFVELQARYFQLKT